MSTNPNKQDQEKGDEVLRRLLKTPPDPKTGKSKDDKEPGHDASDPKPNRGRRS